MRNPIIVALDLPSAGVALDLAGRIAPHVGACKVGKELFVSAGPDLVRQLRATGTGVFLDLKFHDIPHTAARAVAAATRLDVQMITVHAGGGSAMLRAAEAAAQETAASLGRPAPLVLAVTVLTSLSSDELAEVGVLIPVEEQVERLAVLAVRAGIRGLVCSPLELPRLRALLPREIQLVTPGIRAATDAAGDQKRTMSAPDALAAGADWLVIGRPITAAPDPIVAARGLVESLGYRP